MEKRTETEFVESLGLILQRDGLPRIAGRLLGLFVLHDGPFSFAQLSEKLMVSRASVSTNTRLLVDLGMIERVGRPGERQDYFKLSKQPYAQLIERWIGRSRAAQETITSAAETLTAADEATRGRMADLSNFYHVMAQASEQALDALRCGPAKPANERPTLLAGE